MVIAFQEDFNDGRFKNATAVKCLNVGYKIQRILKKLHSDTAVQVRDTRNGE
jgi:hypothetical protein